MRELILLLVVLWAGTMVCLGILTATIAIGLAEIRDAIKKIYNAKEE